MITNNANVPAGERISVLDVIYPGDQAASTVTGGWIDASRFFSFLASVFVGTQPSPSGTVDFKIEQATSSAGAGAKDVTGKAITQITAGSRASRIQFKHVDLDAANDFRYVRISLTTATATVPVCAVLEGLDSRFDPAAVEANVAEDV